MLLYIWKNKDEDIENDCMDLCGYCLLTLVHRRIPQPPNRYPDEVRPFFKHEDWTTTIDFIQDMYGIKKQPLPLKTITSRSQFGVIVSSHEQKFVKALGALIAKLPPASMEEVVNESEIYARFLDPLLCGLFDDPDNGVYF
ncbi:hypothetical protein RMATCC62417_10473 [Rhizopus microsporus]|nr:hypothetical protein RMATCC62417_10473 [Rhizopus microsporus]